MTATVLKKSRFLADIVFKQCQLLFDLNIEQKFPLGEFLFVKLYIHDGMTPNRWLHRLTVPAHQTGRNQYTEIFVNFTCKESLINNLSYRNPNVFLEMLDDEYGRP